jgi:hypothetical protein
VRIEPALPYPSNSRSRSRAELGVPLLFGLLLTLLAPPSWAGTTSGSTTVYAREFGASGRFYTLPDSTVTRAAGFIRSTSGDFFLDVTLGNGAKFVSGGLPTSGNLALTTEGGGAVQIRLLEGGTDGSTSATYFVDVTNAFTSPPTFTLTTTGWKIRDSDNVIGNSGTITLTLSTRDASSGNPIDVGTDTIDWLRGAGAFDPTVLVPTTARIDTGSGSTKFVHTQGDTDTNDNGATLSLAYSSESTTLPDGTPFLLSGSDFVRLTVTGPLSGISQFSWNTDVGGGALRVDHLVTAEEVTAGFFTLDITGSDLNAIGSGARNLLTAVDGTTTLAARTLKLGVSFFKTSGGSSFSGTLLADTTLTVWTTSTTPIPVITSLSPDNAPAGSAQFTLTVNGFNFVLNSVVRWKGSDRTTVYVSNTQLTATIPASDLVSPGTAQVTAFNPAPGGGLSTASTFNINNPVPVLISISPTSAAVGGAAFTLTVTGSNFVASSVVRWNGSSRTTALVSATQLTASIPATDLETGGSVSVTVFNPSPGGGASAAVTFTVTYPVPVLSSLSPASATAGAAAFTLTVNGTGFGRGSTVRWNGADRTTSFVSGSRLTASIPAADVAAQGSASVTVFNPAPGGGLSNALTFAIGGGGPTFSITMSQTSYVTGQQVTAPEFRIRNTSSSSAAAEIKVWLEIPGAQPISLINFGSDGSLVLPANFDMNLGPVTLFVVSAGIPSGNWALNSRTLDPVTGALLSEDLNPFSINAPALPETEDAAEAPAASLVITLSSSSYANGDTVTVTELRFVNPDPTAAAVEAKVWLRNPGALPLSILNLGAAGDFSLPAGANFNAGPIGLFPVTAGSTRGSYEFSGRLLDPVTGKLLSEDLNPFSIP